MGRRPDVHAQAVRFDFVHVAYYFGAMLVLTSMGLFMGTHWDDLGDGGVCLVAVAYAAGFVAGAQWLWKRTGLRTPTGLLVTLAIGMTPLISYSLQSYFGWWPGGDPGDYRDYYHWIRGGWFGIEVATLVAGGLALRFWQFPFMVAPIAFTLWFMSMDITQLLVGVHPTSIEYADASMYFGLMILVVGYVVDRKVKEDYAFWLYQFGMIAFWCGLSAHNSDREFDKFVYFCINMLLIGVSLLFDRRVFIVFGGLGVTEYIGYLAFKTFEHSVLFPFVLSFIGIAIMAGTVYVVRRRDVLQARFDRMISDGLRALLPPRR